MKNLGQPIHIAILDLYAGEVNQGIEAILLLINNLKEKTKVQISTAVFDVRNKCDLPNLDFDIYISSGGPGSPFAQHSPWESLYFDWIDSLITHNNNPTHLHKKYVFFICHSFQMACRHFNLAALSKRSRNAFGIYPVNLTPDGINDPLFSGLAQTIQVVDSRDYQATLPNYEELKKSGSTILAMENNAENQDCAIMAIRFNGYMYGTQFHPEADEVGLLNYLNRAESKQKILLEHGQLKWEQTMSELNDPSGIRKTYQTLLPNFLSMAISHHQKNAMEYDS
jgi:GMP synthase-like glutamine amidotransferase